MTDAGIADIVPTRTRKNRGSTFT